MKIDLNKKYQTRDGREVRLLMVDGGGNLPVVGAVRSSEGWRPWNWTEDGKSFRFGGNSGDLIPVPETFDAGVWWANVDRNYKGELIIGSVSRDKSASDSFASTRRIACLAIPIKGTVGEGLEEKR